MKEIKIEVAEIIDAVVVKAREDKIKLKLRLNDKQYAALMKIKAEEVVEGITVVK